MNCAVMQRTKREKQQEEKEGEMEPVSTSALNKFLPKIVHGLRRGCRTTRRKWPTRRRVLTRWGARPGSSAPPRAARVRGEGDGMIGAESQRGLLVAALIDGDGGAEPASCPRRRLPSLPPSRARGRPPRLGRDGTAVVVAQRQ